MKLRTGSIPRKGNAGRPIFAHMRKWLMRWLSEFVPVRIERRQGRYGILELALEHGQLVVNSLHANQSYGSLHRIWQACFRDIGIEHTPPGRVLLLGYGGGSVARILRTELGLSCSITAVENDPLMVEWARTHFGLDKISGLTLLETDAVQALATLQQAFDLVIVDLFIELDVAPGTGEPDFLNMLRDKVLTGGTLLFNTIAHDAPSTALSARIGDQLRLRFGTVTDRRYEGDNVMFIAR